MVTGWNSQTGLFEQFAGFFGLEEIDLAGYAGRSVPMDVVDHCQIELGGRRHEYRLIASRSARKLRVRVGLDGIEVVRPVSRSDDDVASFLDQNEKWILDQLQRVERLRKIRLPERQLGEILFRGDRTRVRIEETQAKSRGNLVNLVGSEIVVRRGSGSRTPASHSLENWLRRQARAEIQKQLVSITARLRLRPRRIYVMAQRTKWGNCSAGGNLSFNWRLILAPDFVLRYLVTHEAVHLAVPDHSAKFWLTVQSLCPEMERAKQWLSANGLKIAVKLDGVCEEVGALRRHVRGPSRRAAAPRGR
jgi:predicted metal-dependent hydrolase